MPDERIMMHPRRIRHKLTVKNFKNCEVLRTNGQICEASARETGRRTASPGGPPYLILRGISAPRRANCMGSNRACVTCAGALALGEICPRRRQLCFPYQRLRQVCFCWRWPRLRLEPMA